MQDEDTQSIMQDMTEEQAQGAPTPTVLTSPQRQLEALTALTQPRTVGEHRYVLTASHYELNGAAYGRIWGSRRFKHLQ